MKYSLILLLISSSAFAQHYNSNPSADRPMEATGPGVSYTQVVVGKVIGVGSQIIKNVPTAVTCTNQNGETTSHSMLNSGTAIGGVLGGIAGNQIGGGNGKKVATVGGAVLGAIVGNEINKRSTQNEQRVTLDNGCELLSEARIVGWSYTATYGGLQMQGVMNGRQPIIGEDVKIILTSTLYAGE